jgi:uncharacterized repeat protein (TIGR01451 family)
MALASAWLIAGATGMVRAAEPVTSTLTVSRVVALGSQEQLQPASTARPGDTLVYTLDLHNGGVGSAHGLSATLPIPIGTELVADSMNPAVAQASLDGTSYAALPLKRVVHLADGSAREVVVPVSEYRFLRWAPSDIAANGDLKVSARVRVSAPPNAVASIAK